MTTIQPYRTLGKGDSPKKPNDIRSVCLKLLEDNVNVDRIDLDDSKSSQLILKRKNIAIIFNIWCWPFKSVLAIKQAEKHEFVSSASHTIYVSKLTRKQSKKAREIRKTFKLLVSMRKQEKIIGLLEELNK